MILLRDLDEKCNESVIFLAVYTSIYIPPSLWRGWLFCGFHSGQASFACNNCEDQTGTQITNLHVKNSEEYVTR